MYAYVRYIEDNVRKTVPTHHIENFHPKDLHDFNVKKRYRILWKRTPEESGAYYDGQILKLADNEGGFTKGRIPVPPVESEGEESAAIASGSGIKRKEKKAHIAKAQKGSLLEIMKEKKAKITEKREREESDDEMSVPYKLHEELQDKYILIKKKNKDNEILLAEKADTIQRLKEKNKELSDELKTIRSLNLRLQEQLLSTPGILKQSLPESRSTETGLEAAPEAPEVITPELEEDGKIKLGPGVFLNKEKWQRVQQAKSHSQFCKSLAVAIWGSEELKERSVTGAKSNAVKDSVPKPPLSPEKVTVIRECLRDRLVKLNYPKEAIEQQLALVRRSISEKISDIRKRCPQAEGKQKESQGLE